MRPVAVLVRVCAPRHEVRAPGCAPAELRVGGQDAGVDDVDARVLARGGVVDVGAPRVGVLVGDSGEAPFGACLGGEAALGDCFGRIVGCGGGF